MSVHEDNLEIQYNCNKEGRSIVKYNIELSDIINYYKAYKSFSILKRCGEIGLFSFRMGLKKFSQIK
jgi:hypothetical protein